MTLPRLRADLRDGRAIARVLRAALRHEAAVVPLAADASRGGVSATLADGQHVLEVVVPGEAPITLLADPAGPARVEGQPLRLRALTRAQMAKLFALIEQLDEPSRTEPPGPDPSGPPSLPAGGDGDTIVDRMPFDLGPIDVVSSIPVAWAEQPIRDRGTLSPGAVARLPSDLAPPPSPRISVGPPRSGLMGRTIARKYRLDGLLGSGSSAAVYRAQHTDLGRAVAIKVLHPHNQSDMQFVGRFKAEARAASRLEHVNVVRILDFGEEPDGLLYLVMEMLHGRSLEATLKEAGGRLPQAKAVALAIQAASALAHAHDAGVLHRDVKPENLMLVPSKDDDGNAFDLVKVCDFGLAKLGDAGGDGESLTLVGMLCGSPAYMSPEQGRGDALDARSDIYSLGITLYEALTGDVPHDADGVAELLMKKTLNPPRPARDLLPDIDPAIEEILMRAIATDPRRRPTSARVLRDELRVALEGLDVSPSEREPTIFAD